MTTTREIYLDNFEKLPETEIAKLAGVSRQRIHQLEAKFSVCKMAPSLKPNLEHYCIDCGKQIQPNSRNRKYIRCQKCYFKAHKAKRIKLKCPTCKKKFPISKKKYEYMLKRGQQQFFCSRKCHGVWLGKKYGANNFRTYWQHHKHSRKIDWKMIWQKYQETHYGSLRLSRLLGIPQGSIERILAAKRKETGIRYPINYLKGSHYPTKPCKWDYEFIWSKHVETGFGSVRLSRLLNISEHTLDNILRKKRKEMAIS